VTGMAKVLVVEDDAQIRKFLRISLEANGYAVVESRLGELGIDLCSEQNPDLIVLDLGLPDVSGYEVIRRLREWTRIPIIVLSVRAEDQDKVRALDAGANDYVTKPFSIAELMARLRALLRTVPEDGGAQPAAYQHGDLEVDLARRRVLRAGEEQHLSRKEYDLLRLLVTNAGQVLTHQQILREIWGPTHSSDVHYLRVLVGNLRQKLGDDPTKPRLIHTVQGVGYRLIEAG
jgi:two-component system KDP operon response regulator KdpE